MFTWVRLDDMPRHESTEEGLEGKSAKLIEAAPPQYPTSAHCVGETSGVKSPILVEDCSVTVHGPTSLDIIVPAQCSPSNDNVSSPKEDDHAEFERLSYESEFPCRTIATYDPQNTVYLNNNIAFLQSLVGRIHPKTPNFRKDFVLKANAILELIAFFGIPEDIYRKLEATCRAAEYVLRQMESLTMVQTLIPLSTRQAHAEFYKVAFECARNKYWESDDVLKEQVDRETSLTSDLEGFSNRIDEICQELKDKSSAPVINQENFNSEVNRLCSEFKGLSWCRTNLQMKLDELKRSICREQNRHHTRMNNLQEAEAAMVRANKELQIAKEEYESLETCMSHIQNLYNRLK